MEMGKPGSTEDLFNTPFVIFIAQPVFLPGESFHSTTTQDASIGIIGPGECKGYSNLAIIASTFVLQILHDYGTRNRTSAQGESDVKLTGIFLPPKCFVFQFVLSFIRCYSREYFSLYNFLVSPPGN